MYILPMIACEPTTTRAILSEMWAHAFNIIDEKYICFVTTTLL